MHRTLIQDKDVNYKYLSERKERRNFSLLVKESLGKRQRENMRRKSLREIL
jgi:hypothetical protein